MSLHRWFGMVLVLIALPFAATPASARSVHARAVRTPEDDAQMRELLSKLAAASGQAAPEERTDADLMYDAMLRWNGEPADSGAVDRLIESSKKEAARSKRATVDKVRSMFWKDPFATDPHRLIPVRQEDRDLLDDYERRAQRRADVRQGHAGTGREAEVARLRAEVEAARADAIAARTENARLRELEATSDRRECVADTDARAEVRRRRRSAGSPSRGHRHAEQMLTQVAMATPAASVQSYQPPPAPPPPVSTPIPAHGIIVVPLPSPPPPVAVVEKGRRSPSSRSTR
jgi:hypothetical protein